MNEKTKDNSMIQFDEMHHEFRHENRKAEVGLKDGVWGIRMWEDMIWKSDEMIPGHSELYAENAAENYVLGIKN